VLDLRIIYSLFDIPDNKEGVQGFLEKRKVNLKGMVMNDIHQAYPWWEPIE